MHHSDKLFYTYCVGATLAVIIGIWLAHRHQIETPVLLSIVTGHEWMLLIFAVFWPILGPAVLLEIVLRGWVRRRAREKAERLRHIDERQRTTNI